MEDSLKEQYEYEHNGEKYEIDYRTTNDSKNSKYGIFFNIRNRNQGRRYYNQYKQGCWLVL